MKEKIRFGSKFFDCLAERYPKKRANVRARVVDEETIVLDRRQGLIHQLNHTAGFIWERCDGRCTLEEIATRLVETFDVDFNTAVDDVRKIVEQLEERKLLEPQLKL